MSVIPFLDVISFSAEHSHNKVKNIVSGHSGKWTCPQKFTEKSIDVELSIPPAFIEGIDVGNFGSASIEVQVNRSGNPISKRETLIFNTVLMTRIDWARGANKETMKFFGKENFDLNVSSQWWDRVRFVCHQPFSTSNFDVFGLSKIVIRGRRLSETNSQNIQTSNLEGNTKIVDGVQKLIEKIDKQLTSPKVPNDVESSIDKSRISSFGKNSSDRLERGSNSKAQNVQRPNSAGSKRNRGGEDDIFSNKPDASYRNNVALFDLPQRRADRIEGPSNEKLLKEFSFEGPDQQHFCTKNPPTKLDLKALLEKDNSPGIIDFSNLASLKKFTRDELKSHGILVQSKTYKKPKTLPLENGDTISTTSGQIVNFYKQGPIIYMEVSGTIYRPKVEVEHISGIFKDFSTKDLNLEEFSQLNTHDLKCPLCTRGFTNEQSLIDHCEDCNGSEQAEKQNSKQCPICLETFAAEKIQDHAERCAEQNFG